MSSGAAMAGPNPMDCLGLHLRHAWEFCVTFPFLWTSLKDFREQLVLAAGYVPEEPTSKERRTFGAMCGGVAVALLLCMVHGGL